MSQPVHDKMRVLAGEYAAKLPQKIQELEGKWILARSSLNTKDISEVVFCSHLLCGTAGTFGFQEISKRACQIEATLHRYKDHLSQKQVTEIDVFIKEIKQLVMQISELSTDQRFSLDLPIFSNERRIYILDREFSDRNLEELKLNFQVDVFTSEEALSHAIKKNPPDMLIINTKFTHALSEEMIQKLQQDFVSIIYMADQDDLSSRLFSIRQGGQAFIAKPFEVAHLLHMIDNLFDARQLRHEHVLIVDDSEALANYYAELIKHAGMTPLTVTKTENFLNALQEFQPDLILMDINMPFCSGIELAQIVQQQETMSAVPIIFLSTISERSKQLQALSIAGDDFLTKPVEPKHLLTAIRSRLMRSRILRSRMMRDSLTNLYNHTMIHYQLDREIALASRYHRTVSIALIDIDHFKNINDSYGHQVGDKILKDLSSYLLTNLRKIDIVGRYGGEEFLLIFPETDAKQAYRILDGIRYAVATTPHVVEKEKIFIQISGGVAEYPRFKRVGDLVKAADKALYEAKNAGRNRIVVQDN